MRTETQYLKIFSTLKSNFSMKNFNITIDWESPTFGKYRRMVALLTLFALFFAKDVSAQGQCSGISFSFEHYEPCKFRARYSNTSECFIEIRYILESGTFSSWSVNSAAGFTVDVISPSELWIHHNQGFVPLGNQVPLLFTLPPDLNTTMNIAYLDNCAMVGCEIFGGIPIESCQDPKDASIIGVKYRECGSLPYTNQTIIPDWTVQLLNVDGNVIGEQVTDAGGAYAFFDLPLGQYIVRETVKPGWTSKVPLNGQYTVNLAPSQQATRNFGNCPGCSCDSIYMDVVQKPDTSSGSCSYSLSVDNTGAYCFTGFNVSIESDTFASIKPAPGWTVVEIDCQHFTLDPPNNYLLSGHLEPCLWRIVGGDNHNITVSTSWDNAGVPVKCTRVFSYQCPPPSSPAPCCPAGSSFGNELVLNSDFQLGNQDFTNDYTYFNPGGPASLGKYSVLTQGQVFPANNQWTCSDHTLLSGKMLILDGYGGPIAWQQTVNVTAGTNYAFSAWVNNLVRPPKNYDDPQMALFVGSNPVAGPLNLPETPDQWVRLCGTWTAMASGPVVLSIRMLATTVVGNDVGIDDVSFRACIPQQCGVSISANPTPFCGTGTLTANPTGLGPFSYQWSHGQSTPSINVQNLSCGTVCSVSVTCADGTMSSASYTVTDNVPPVAVCNLGIGIDLGTACTFQVTPAFVDGGSTDNCQIQSMSVSPAVLQACTNTIVTLTVTDWCGNTSTCTMGIQTAEGVPPLMTCPANTTINGTVGPTGLCTAVFSPVPPVAFDNCDPSVTVTNNAPAIFQQGPNTITWTATDDCGNETTCTQIVTVQCGHCIEDFETSSLGQWQGLNGQVSIITDPNTGSQVLKGNDDSGPSWMYNNSSAYSGDWTQKFNNCLCFDIRYDKGDPANPGTGTGAITIYQGNDPLNTTKRATFVVNTPIGNTWTRVCVPVGLSNGTAYPSNQYGQWTSTSFADFDMVMQGVSGIGIPLDFGGGQSPTEMVFVDNFCVEKCAGTACECKTGDLTYSSAGVSHTIPCNSPNFPVFFCPTAPVTISGAFGCVDANGNPCPIPPSPINWTLFHNGIVQQGTILTGSPWTLNFTAADLAGSGFFTLYMTTLCPGQMDSCKCVATWFQECVPCVCGPNPWSNEFRYGGAQNIPVQCGQTLNVTSGSAFYPKFNCQGPANCGRVDWVLSGPNGYLQSAIGVIPSAGGGFIIPQLQPTNFPDPGTYCLEMLGICGQDTCPCKICFCLPPQAPTINDTSICRTLTSAYIPLYGCPTTCGVTQVQWFVKPCSVANWPTTPYQVSAGPGCDPLLFLPYQYPGEACVQVYAVVTLAPGCCVPDLTTNIATINLCNPISCSITNPNPPFCQTGQPVQMTAVLNGANCNYTIEWRNESGQVVSTSLTYTPPVLNFPAGSTACYKDFVYTVKITGLCGMSTCTTSIRVYNINADNGDLAINPIEPLPLCPGEDVIVEYTDKCSGPPPKWTWYSSIDGVNYAPIAGAGMTNSIIYSNRLWQTTWFMVEARNGVCPPKQEVLKVDVKDPLTIVNFSATPDPCIENYVALNVSFTPSPNPGGGQPGCGYTIEWYKDGNLIHTSSSLTSSVSYTYFQTGSVAGVYYAIVKDDCCDQAVQTWPLILNPSCVPVASGPCYICDNGPVKLIGEMVLPPNNPCPPGVSCTYQWYKLNITTGVWQPITGANSLSLTVTAGGHYRFESTCDYGFGPCVKHGDHDVAQCNGCMYVGDHEVLLPANLKVDIQPNPTAGNVTVQVSPSPLRQGRVEVVDLSGKVLASGQMPEAQLSVTLSLAHLPTGLYFVRVYESDVLLWTGKVVRAE